MIQKAPFVGRKAEIEILDKALNSAKPEMVSVIGRRRVGKTFLIKSVYKDRIDFEITGIQYASRKEQLRNFANQLNKFSDGHFQASDPKDWLEAFYFLTRYLEMKAKKDKMVIFLDELPWLSTHKSGFLKGLSYFWNSWAVNHSIVVVICGSAASWMIQKVVHHKGGLHNRITRRISLKPFTLSETFAFFQAKNIGLDPYQILHIYMAMGGVPHYLEEVEQGKSAAQIIDEVCFAENGLLRDEFTKLYSSLFEDSHLHLQIIRILAKRKKGLTRLEILKGLAISDGGGLTKALEELIYSGFISQYYPFGKKKKDRLYRLTDEYSSFYLQFIEPNIGQGEGIWKEINQSSSYQSWAGFAFEGICLKHLPQIKKALNLTGIYSTASAFFYKGSDEEQGFQIDLLIDRKDHVINVCEIKFYGGTFSIDKSMARSLRDKLVRFQAISKTKKQVFLTMITTFGIQENKHSIGLVDQSITMEDLFIA